MITHAWDNTYITIREGLIRPPFFPFLWSLLMRVGFTEVISKFILEFIPSIVSVFFVYLIGKEVFNKRVGWISAIIFSVLWIHLFYTIRFLTNIPSMAFMFPSIYLFILAIKKDFKYNYFFWSIFLLSISTLFRFPNGMVFFAFLLILIFSKKLYLNKKRFWMAGIFGLTPIFLFFLVNYITSGNIFPALFGGNYLTPGEGSSSFAFSVLNLIPTFLQPTFFVFFIIGIALILFEIIIGYNYLSKSQKLRSYLLLTLILLFFNAFFIFYLKGAEDRWLFPTSLMMATFAGFGVDTIYNLIKKHGKQIAIVLVIGVLIFGGYHQLKAADNLISAKKDTYSQMRESFTWIKENSFENEVIAGGGLEPYIVYYSEMQFLGLPENISGMENIEEKADYLVFHSFTQQPEYFIQYLQSNENKWEAMNAWFFDEGKTQPAVVIYKNVEKNIISDLTSKNLSI